MTLDEIKVFAEKLGYTIKRTETDTEIIEEVIRPDKTVAVTAKKYKPFVQQYHPCGHKCYPGAKPSDWCIECKYGDKPYH